MRSPYAPVQYTCAAWSPTRPGDNLNILRSSVSTVARPGLAMQVVQVILHTEQPLYAVSPVNRHGCQMLPRARRQQI